MTRVCVCLFYLSETPCVIMHNSRLVRQRFKNPPEEFAGQVKLFL